MNKKIHQKCIIITCNDIQFQETDFENFSLQNVLIFLQQLRLHYI
jgi:hypothetical protein